MSHSCGGVQKPQYLKWKYLNGAGQKKKYSKEMLQSSFLMRYHNIITINP